MVSDQCQAMERDGVFDDPDTYKELKIRDPIDKHDIVPVVIAENKETKKIDPDFFVVDVRHLTKCSSLIRLSRLTTVSPSTISSIISSTLISLLKTWKEESKP